MKNPNLLSSKQLDALFCARDGGLVRNYDGWWSSKFKQRFQCSTIQSLWWRGLLRTNFSKWEAPLGFGNMEVAGVLSVWIGEPLIANITDWGKITLAGHEVSGDFQNSASSNISIHAKTDTAVPMQHHASFLKTA